MTDSTSIVSRRNPDVLPEVADPDQLEARCAAFLASLGLHRSLVRGRRVLQLGGAAESALQFALWGCEVTLAESDAAAIDRAERLFLRHRQRLRVEVLGDQRGDRAAMSRCDLVIDEDSFLASSDPIGELDSMFSVLPRDAIVLVAVAETHGWSRRVLMRRVVAQLATNAADRMRFALASFPRHLEATSRLRGQDVADVASSIFVEAKTRPCDLSDLLGAFDSSGMTYLSSAPSLRRWNDPASHADRDMSFDASWLHWLERAWRAFGADPRLGEGGGFARIESRIGREIDALAEIERRVLRRDVDDALLADLDSGGFIDRMHFLLAKR